MKIITTLALLSFFCFSAAVPAEGYKSPFTPQELLTGSPFNPSFQTRVLSEVLLLTSQNQKPNQRAPQVVISEEIKDLSPEIRDPIVAQVISQGFPEWAFEKGINVYLIELNIIVLGKNMKLHNLAHELAHFIQFVYQGYSRDEASSDHLEMEAVRIQKYFRP